MLSHVCIGTGDVAAAAAFYARVLEPLEITLRFADPKGAFAFLAKGKARPLLYIGKPFDGAPPTPGNGQMIAFLSASRSAVDACHANARALGARDEGAPGLRPHYHANYYGAYFRDLDGNKVCICCHERE